MIALNHSFLVGVARAPRNAIEALKFLEHVRRRTRLNLVVHSSYQSVETGDGILVKWASRVAKDPELGPIAQVLLRSLNGPFLDPCNQSETVSPSVVDLPAWLQEVIFRLLQTARTRSAGGGALLGLVSPMPHGGAVSSRYTGVHSVVDNWRTTQEFDESVLESMSAKTTREVLDAAVESMGGRLVVLDVAKRSADTWSLDCGPDLLLKALLGLECYVEALEQGLLREACATAYQKKTGVEMSRESGDVGRRPTRRQQRTFMVEGFDKQYFDMHVKPGRLTRVHFWVAPSVDGGIRKIYVGHCGRHLD